MALFTTSDGKHQMKFEWALRYMEKNRNPTVPDSVGLVDCTDLFAVSPFDWSSQATSEIFNT